MRTYIYCVYTYPLIPLRLSQEKLIHGGSPNYLYLCNYSYCSNYSYCNNYLYLCNYAYYIFKGFLFSKDFKCVFLIKHNCNRGHKEQKHFYLALQNPDYTTWSFWFWPEVTTGNDQYSLKKAKKCFFSFKNRPKPAFPPPSNF